MIPYSELVLQEALRNAAERQKGTDWRELLTGRVDSLIGSIDVSFVRTQTEQADGSGARTIIKTCWALNGKRIAHDKLVKALDAAFLAM